MTQADAFDAEDLDLLREMVSWRNDWFSIVTRGERLNIFPSVTQERTFPWANSSPSLLWEAIGDTLLGMLHVFPQRWSEVEDQPQTNTTMTHTIHSLTVICKLIM